MTDEAGSDPPPRPRPPNRERRDPYDPLGLGRLPAVDPLELANRLLAESEPLPIRAEPPPQARPAPPLPPVQRPPEVEAAPLKLQLERAPGPEAARSAPPSEPVAAPARPEAVEPPPARPISSFPTQARVAAAPAPVPVPRPAPRKPAGVPVTPPQEGLALRLRRLVNPRERISQNDVVVFTRQFFAMVSSGLQLHQSLHFYAAGEPDSALARVIEEVADRVSQGNTLSSSLKRHPRVFSEVYVGLIAAGETTGMLMPILGRLADLSERNLKLRRKVSATLTYPLVLLALSVLSILAFLYFVLPMLVPIFTSLKIELPLPTRMLLQVSGLMKSPFFWLAALGGPFALWALWPRLAVASPGLQRNLHRLALELPVAGRLLERLISARILFSLATLLESGYPLSACLEKCEKVAGNLEVAHRLRQARSLLVDGSSAAECLGSAGVFPRGAVQMISVGEETGAIAEMISRVASVYEDEVELALLDLAALLEPLILIGMGLVVGFVVLAAILPTVQLLNHL